MASTVGAQGTLSQQVLKSCRADVLDRRGPERQAGEAEPLGFSPVKEEHMKKLMSLLLVALVVGVIVMVVRKQSA